MTDNALSLDRLRAKKNKKKRIPGVISVQGYVDDTTIVGLTEDALAPNSPPAMVA